LRVHKTLSFEIKHFLRYQVLGFLRCFLLLNFYSKFFIFINFVANFIQESSYYKMLRHIFEPQMCPAQNTGYRGPIFCSISCMGLPTGAIKGIFQFRSWGRDMGDPWGTSRDSSGGSKMVIYRPQRQNSKTPLIAPVGIPIQLIRQNMKRSPIVFSGHFCFFCFKMSLSIL